MSMKDIVFGLRVDSRDFETKMARSGELMRKVASTRLDVLQKDLLTLSGAADVDAKALQKLGKEYDLIAKLNGKMHKGSMVAASGGALGGAYTAGNAAGQRMTSGFLAGAGALASGTLLLPKLMGSLGKKTISPITNTGVSAMNGLKEIREQGLGFANALTSLQTYKNGWTGLTSAMKKARDEASAFATKTKEQAVTMAWAASYPKTWSKMGQKVSSIANTGMNKVKGIAGSVTPRNISANVKVAVKKTRQIVASFSPKKAITHTIKVGVTEAIATPAGAVVIATQKLGELGRALLSAEGRAKAFSGATKLIKSGAGMVTGGAAAGIAAIVKGAGGLAAGAAGLAGKGAMGVAGLASSVVSFVGGAALKVGMVAGAAAAAGMGMALHEGFAGVKVNAQLRAALGDKKPGIGGKESKDFTAIDEHASATRRKLGIEDEDVKAGFAVMVRGHMTVATAMKASATVADIAKAKQISYAAAAEVVTKTYNGETKALREMGIFIEGTGDKQKDAAMGMQALQTAFGGTAAKVAAEMSPMERLSMSFMETMKSAGTQMVEALLPAMTDFAGAFEAFVSSGQFKAWVDALLKGLGAAWTWVQSAISNVQLYGMAFWGWIQQLPAKLAETFSNGSLSTAVFTWIGGIAVGGGKILWAGIKALGATMINGVWNAFPAIVSGIGKFLIDGLKSALGERVSKMLGLDNASKKLEEFSASKAKEYVGTEKQILGDVTAAVQGAGKDVSFGNGVMSQFAGDNLGWNDQLGKAKANMVGGGPMARGYNQWVNAGKAQSAADERALAQTRGTAGEIGVSQRATNMSNAANAKDKAAQQEAENYNAKVQGRKPMKILIEATQNFNPVMATQ